MRELFTPLDEAKYRVVHDFSGGAAALAPLVRMNPGTLSNKVNPSVETHHLTIDEAVAIQHTARDCRILYAEAHLLGHTCIPLGEFASISDTELLDAYARYHAEVGETAEAIRASLADGRVTPAEFAHIDREMMEDIQAKFELRARLKALVVEAA